MGQRFQFVPSGDLAEWLQGQKVIMHSAWRSRIIIPKTQARILLGEQSCYAQLPLTMAVDAGQLLKNRESCLENRTFLPGDLKAQI